METSNLRARCFWKIWIILMGMMVISRLLRGLGIYYPISSSMIGNVMFVIVQILCVLCSTLLLFEFVKPLYEWMLRFDFKEEK